MTVDPSDSGGAFEYRGTTYHFCCEGCLEAFKLNPEDYLDENLKKQKKAAKAASAPENAVYTCPMHPEVRQQGAGSCPICGMALEPLEVTADSGPDPELIDMSRRFKIAAVLSAPIELFPVWAQFILATLVTAGAGFPILKRGVESLRNRNWNMFTLIVLGVGAAYFYSLFVLLFPGVVPAGSVYFEPAAGIVALVLLGQFLELKARGQTSGAIRALLNLSPKSALRIVSGAHDEEVAIDQIEPGNLLRLRPGEKVAVDGIVVEGQTSIDESMITGESMPVQKGPGVRVLAGTIGQNGTLVYRAEKVGRDTVLAQIVRMVSEAQRSRAPIQRLADRVSSYFVPGVVICSALTAAAWMIFGPDPRLSHALANAVAVLIIACPCALGLATPMSIMVGTGTGAKHGVLVKNAEALETLEKVTTLVIDKTGTLTEGKPRVVSVTGAAGVSADHLMSKAAALEIGSEHPLASAILSEARNRGIQPLSTTRDFQSVAGQGVRAQIEGELFALGSHSFMAEFSAVDLALFQEADRLREEGQTVVFLCTQGKLLGLIGIKDPVKPGARRTIDQLKSLGLQIVMMTGDHEITAQAVARELGIDDVRSGVLPEHKDQAVLALQESGQRVAMAGDGVNDAPALARAEVGIAMGTGTDVAIESAGITLVKGDLQGIVRAILLSRATMRNIRQNLFFAFVYNLAGVPIAAGLLYPFFGWLLSPMIASAAMSLSSVSVIGNALRLRKVSGVTVR